jgi:hypothetical protein
MANVNVAPQFIRPVVDGSPSSTQNIVNLSDVAVRMMGASATQVSLTGTTAETVMATVTIPANALGPNGMIRVQAFFSGMTSSANTKTIRYRLNGLSGTSMVSLPFSTVTTGNLQGYIQNRGSVTSQVGWGSGCRGTDGLQTQTGPNTGAIDTKASVDLVISAQLASGAEAITMDQFLVELIPG